MPDERPSDAAELQRDDRRSSRTIGHAESTESLLGDPAITSSASSY